MAKPKLSSTNPLQENTNHWLKSDENAMLQQALGAIDISKIYSWYSSFRKLANIHQDFSNKSYQKKLKSAANGIIHIITGLPDKQPGAGLLCQIYQNAGVAELKRVIDHLAGRANSDSSLKTGTVLLETQADDRLKTNLSTSNLRQLVELYHALNRIADKKNAVVVRQVIEEIPEKDSLKKFLKDEVASLLEAYKNEKVENSGYLPGFFQENQLKDRRGEIAANLKFLAKLKLAFDEQQALLREIQAFDDELGQVLQVPRY